MLHELARRHDDPAIAPNDPPVEQALFPFRAASIAPREASRTKAASSPAKTSCISQVAALPVRIDTGGKPWILLVTSRETSRWIIPKGWTMKGRRAWEAAAIEAIEEAGVVGRLRRKPIGSYHYFNARRHISISAASRSMS